MGNLSDLNFNANEVDPAGSFDPLPAGIYPAVIMDSEVKPTKAGTGQYIQLQFEVLSGEHKGRYVWDRITIKNPSAKAVEIGMAQFSALCRAVNVPQPNDTVELHNIPLNIKVAQRKRQDTGEMTNEVKAYEANGNSYQHAKNNSNTITQDDLAKSNKEDGLPF